MKRRRAITLTLAGLSGMSLSLLAGCARPPECTARMSDQECQEAVIRANQERLRKAAEEELERFKQEAARRGEELVADGQRRAGEAIADGQRRAGEAVADGQRRAGEAVADGQSRIKRWWDDLWKPAPKPQDPSKPQGPVIVTKDGPSATFAIISLPVARDKLEWFNWYGATQYAWNDHLKDNENQEYDKTRDFHSGLDYGVHFKTPIVNCANQEGTVIAVSEPPRTPLNFGAGPQSVIMLYREVFMVYGHVWPLEVPAVGAKIQPGDRIALSGTNVTIDPSKIDLNKKPVPREQGYPHLHLEVIKFGGDWKPPDAGQPVKTRPGNVRTNPAAFFTPQLRQQFDSPSFPQTPMQFPSKPRVGDQYDQPDIDPSVGGSCWKIDCYKLQ